MRLILVLFAVHYVVSQSDNGQKLTNDQFASGINSLSLNLTKRLEFDKKNILFSPFGIAMTIGMLLEGAEGKDSEDMYKLLGVNQYSNKERVHDYFKALLDEYKGMATRQENPRNATCELSNLLLAQKGYEIPPNFIDSLKNDYDATFDHEDFKTNGTAIKDKINKFVDERTHGLIKSILTEPPHPNTIILLLNTIFFKGFWSNMFDSGATRNETFYNYDKSESKVPMMKRNAHYNFQHSEEHKASIIELPYLGDISMYILLPDEKYDLKEMIEGLKPNELQTFIEDMSSTDIDLRLPKFEYDASIDLLQTLPKLGVDIRQVLRPLDKQLIVSSASHEAKIKVHESGTEAAAVTVLQFHLIRPGPPRIKIPIRVDHPFVYIIRDNKSKVNLFVGIVNEIK